VTGGRLGAPPPGDPVPAVYFLSDYGTEDEFVGLVHAVLHRLAPGTAVIDLGHQVPAFDVAAGAAMLHRCSGHLGPGVVLAVVDPGVGTARRGVALGVPPPGPEWLVGPDNGLLVPLADALGGVRTAFALDRERLSGSPAPGTFDGRDVFAPAAAHLVRGGEPPLLGVPFDPATLVGPNGTVDATAAEGGHLTTAVSWIDRYGNVELELDPAALAGLGLGPGGDASVTITGDRPGAHRARWVEAFGQLKSDELGLLVDGSGRMALVMDRASAHGFLGGVTPGTTVLIGALPGFDRG
jgi:S-adenosylmethionine hydrolase